MADITYHSGRDSKAINPLGRFTRGLRRFFAHVMAARQEEANRRVAAYLRHYSGEDRRRYRIDRRDLPF